jgi:dolichyl-phosphate-mannose-protein mannosyltransferase
MTADNLHVVETRLILLDGALILSMALSLLSYIKFHQQRYRAFTAAWWMWLAATGFWLACTLGCKMVGLFTFLTVGTAVAWDLWDLMNVKRRSPLTMVRRRRAAQTRSSTDRPLRHLQEQFSKHFFARVGCLILLPLCVYLSFFWIHFKVLKFSGTGDSFMSAAFQETLQGNELLLHAQGPSESERCWTLLRLTDLGCTPPTSRRAELRYYDIVTVKHKDTGFYLHTHTEHYPLKYDDGRISSQGASAESPSDAPARPQLTCPRVP